MGSLCRVKRLMDKRRIKINRNLIIFFIFLLLALVSHVHAESNLDSIDQLIRAGDYKQAVNHLKKITRKEPSNVRAWNLLGQSYIGLEKHQKAITAYEQAIQIEPENEDAFFGLGIAFYMMHSYSSAIESYKKVIEFNPKHAEAHYQLGVLYDRTSRLTEAFEEYKILKTIDERLAEELYHTILGN
jgi:Flp pilus assembly protein TadD